MTTEPQVADPAPANAPTRRRDRVIGCLLLAVSPVLLVCSLVMGERPTDLASLRDSIATGDVTEVRVSEGLPAGVRGNAMVAIRWEEHGITHVTSVTQASSERVARRLGRTGGVWGRGGPWGPGGRRPDVPVVVGDVADSLTTAGREVQVVGSTPPYYHGSVTTSAYGLAVPGWIVGLGMLALCATLLLVATSETWRATRWAWAWIILSLPFGGVAFILLGGPLGLFRPRPGSYRLTGGWAFLLAGAIGTAFRSASPF